MAITVFLTVAISHAQNRARNFQYLLLGRQKFHYRAHQIRFGKKRKIDKRPTYERAGRRQFSPGGKKWERNIYTYTHAAQAWKFKKFKKYITTKKREYLNEFMIESIWKQSTGIPAKQANNPLEKSIIRRRYSRYDPPSPAEPLFSSGFFLKTRSLALIVGRARDTWTRSVSKRRQKQQSTRVQFEMDRRNSVEIDTSK